MDFAEWKKATGDLLAGLKKKRAEVVAAQNALTKELGDIDAQIDEITNGAVTKGFYSPEAEEKKRASGILSLLRVKAMTMVEWMTFDAIFDMVRMEIPNAAIASVRSALIKLVDEGVLEHQGERRSHNKLFRGKAAAASAQGVQAPQDAPAAPASPERPPAPQPPASAPLLLPAAIEAMKAMLAKGKPMGIEEKDVSWLAIQIGTSEHNIRESIRTLVADGAAKIDYIENKKVLVVVPAPGSKEELKTTHIKDQPLFQGMDRPPHA